MIKRFKRDDETNSTKLSTVPVTETTITISTSSINTTNSARVSSDATTGNPIIDFSMFSSQFRSSYRDIWT